LLVCFRLLPESDVRFLEMEGADSSVEDSID
jgi:hypothetical protein